MAKKKRTQRSQGAPRAAAPVVAPAKRPAPVEAPLAPAAEADFAHEYRYVLGDLRRIGVLAAAMFATLVALALILP